MFAAKIPLFSYPVIRSSVVHTLCCSQSDLFPCKTIFPEHSADFCSRNMHSSYLLHCLAYFTQAVRWSFYYQCYHKKFLMNIKAPLVFTLRLVGGLNISCLLKSLEYQRCCTVSYAQNVCYLPERMFKGYSLPNNSPSEIQRIGSFPAGLCTPGHLSAAQ